MYNNEEIREVAMLRRTLQTIDEHEVYSYLGIQEKEFDATLYKQMQEVKADILQHVHARLIYKIYSYQEGKIEHCSFSLLGDSIQQLLKSSHKCILVAATLGTWMDQRIKKAQLQDMGKAILYDAYANAAIEQVMDDWQEEMAKEFVTQGEYITDRFSPGYGDFPLSIQPAFLKEIEAQKRMGLQVNDSLLMKPEKSITAIIGIAREPQIAMVRGCEVCAYKDVCTKRKEGHPCGKQ